MSPKRTKKAKKPVRLGPPPQGWAAVLPFLVALGIGVAAQLQLVQWDEPKTLAPGLFLLFLSLALFAVFARRWPDPEIDRKGISPRLEWTLFGIALLVGLFMRFFRIGTMPSGLFVDQGYQGLAALKILHEGWRPFYVEETLHAPAYALYQQAGWFGIFGATQASLRSFFAFLSFLSLPFVYWAVRQLFGVRTALVSLFILAAMRWNINFSRNGFPSIQILIYMFATLALLLYAWRTRKRWAFVVAAVTGALGLYTYQAYKLFPVLLAMYLGYEFLTDRKTFKSNRNNLIVFAAVFGLLVLPLVVHVVSSKDAMYREGGLSIMNKVEKEGSLAPLVKNWYTTAAMFNRRGDRQPRHNLQDNQMLDTLSGVFLWFGVILALRLIRQRKYFYVVSGFLVMSLACLLSVDAAHANRMVGTTPFQAVLIALPLVFLWDRLAAAWRATGHIVAVSLTGIALLLILGLNYHVYFDRQANHYYGWKEYSIEETKIGQRIAEFGKTTDFYLTPYFHDHHTIEFLGYDHLKNVYRAYFTDDLAPLRTGEGRAAAFAYEPMKKPVLELMRDLYPNARVEIVPDIRGNDLFYWLWLDEKQVRESQGLKAELTPAKTAQCPLFPRDLPAGPYVGRFHGSVYLPNSGPYRFQIKSNAVVSMSVSGAPLTPGENRYFTRGYHPVEFRVRAGDGPVNLSIVATNASVGTYDLNSSQLTTLVLNRGLRGTYWKDADFQGEPVVRRNDPLLNFTNGNELVIKDLPLTAEWKGTLIAPVSGTYEFQAKANDYSELTLDGQKIISFAKEVKQMGLGRIALTAGPHDIHIRLKKLEGYGAAYELFWTRPDRKTPESIPNSAFGVLP